MDTPSKAERRVASALELHEWLSERFRALCECYAMFMQFSDGEFSDWLWQQMKAAALTLPVLCDECGHAAHRKACEVERGDQFVEGQNGGAYMAQGPCGCTELTER